MVELNLYSRDFIVDPYPVYAALRDQAPVYHNPEMNFWALSRYDDVVAAHRDAATFSSAKGTTLEGTEAAMPLLIVKDQPEHGRAKAFVVKLFSRPRMEAMDVFIRRRTLELLSELYDRHGPDGEFDLVSNFSVQLPLDVISELLGIPEELRGEIHCLSNQVIYRGEDQDPHAAGVASMRLAELYIGLARDRRANPRDDVVSMLIAEEAKDDQGAVTHMSDEEIGFRFLELGFAGHETVAKALPNGAMAFSANPEQWAMLRADPARAAQAVDEILRYDPPSQLQGRTTTRPVTLHGVTIPQDVRVMLLTGSATRDPRAFADPDRFDVTRKIDPKSIFFGYGVHKCLGIHLAQREIAIVFEELARRFPQFIVDASRATRAIMSNVRGVGSLPMKLGPQAS